MMHKSPLRIEVFILLSLFLLQGTYQLELSHFGEHFQAHGFEETDVIANLIAKGATYFKIDISMAAKESCQEFSTWGQLTEDDKTKSESHCLDQKGLQVCCLAVRGDTSSHPFLNDYFNTTRDFVDYLQSEEMYQIMSDPQQKPLYFSVDQQYSSFTGATNVMTLDFYESLAKSVQTTGFDINFVMGNCLMNELREICEKTFTSEKRRSENKYQGVECTDQMKRVLSLTVSTGKFICDTTGAQDSEFSKEFNTEYTNILPSASGKDHCTQGFPLWVQQTLKPMTFWEFGSERLIQDFVGIIQDKKKCPGFQAIKDKDWRLTSNIEPERMEIYLQNLQTKLPIKLMDKPVQQLKAFQFNQNIYLAIQQSSSYRMFSYDTNDKTYKELGVAQTFSGQLQLNTLKQIDNTNQIGVYQKNGSFVTYEFDGTQVSALKSSFCSGALSHFSDYLTQGRYVEIMIQAAPQNAASFQVLAKGMTQKTPGASLQLPPMDKITSSTGIYDPSSQKYYYFISGQVQSRVKIVYVIVIHFDEEFNATEITMSPKSFFGEVTDLSLRRDFDELGTIDVLTRHSPCLNGNGLINNNAFYKCNMKELLNDPRLEGMTNNSFSMRYYSVRGDQLANASEEIAGICSKELFSGDLFYAVTGSLLSFKSQEGQKGLLFGGYIHEMQLDSFGKIICGSLYPPPKGPDVITGLPFLADFWMPTGKRLGLLLGSGVNRRLKYVLN